MKGIIKRNLSSTPGAIASKGKMHILIQLNTKNISFFIYLQKLDFISRDALSVSSIESC